MWMLQQLEQTDWMLRLLSWVWGHQMDCLQTQALVLSDQMDCSQRKVLARLLQMDCCRFVLL
jgi:hypothetical protein